MRRLTLRSSFSLYIGGGIVLFMVLSVVALGSLIRPFTEQDSVHEIESAGASGAGQYEETIGIVLTSRSSEVMALYDVAQTWLWVGGLAMALVALGFAILLSRCITRPLRQLMTASQAMAEGDLSVTVKEEGVDEVYELSKSFNTMARRLETLAAVSERQRVEAQLKQSEARSQAIVEAAADAIFTVDFDGIIKSCNSAATTIFGYATEELVGQSVDTLIPWQATRQHQGRPGPNTGETFADGRYRQVQGRRKDSSVVPLSLHVKAVDVNHQRLFAIITRDISERVRTEQALKEYAATLDGAREAAESANRTKSAFLANMSHEIRTPMNGVMGMAAILRETELTHEQLEYVQTIESSSETLLAVINDILDFSKVEAGKIDIEEHTFDLHTLVAESTELLGLRAVEKGVELIYELDEELPQLVVGDPTRIRQVLLNLLSNAIKFTSNGEVTIASTTENRDDETVEVCFNVRDTGIGVAEDRLETIFDPFSQADSSTTRKFGGTGLGLSISKRLSRLLRGDLTATSQTGEGSCFSFRFQVRRVEDTEELETGPRTGLLKDKRILVVDDNQTNLRVVRCLVERWGATCVSTTSPREALDWVQAGESFDSAVIDMQMPELDGISLMREIHKVVPLRAILLSSMGSRPSGAEEVFAARMTKPARPNNLFVTLAGLTKTSAIILKRRAAPRTAAIAPQPPTGSPATLRILVAEDNLVNQKVTTHMLQRRGYKSDLVENGIEALEAVREGCYDIVLMDIHMPKMDGLHATRELRKLDLPHQPYVIALTANAFEQARNECFDAGMDDFVVKPVRLGELVAALGRAFDGDEENKV
jgi:PAS domain S-box-containing protein